MEQLLLKMNHEVDQANQSREEFKIESEMSKVEKIRLEERTNAVREQYNELKQKISTMQDEFDKKLNQKQMEIWKTEMTQRSMAQQMMSLTEEIERLRKAKDVGESIMRLPMVCLEDMKTEDDIRQVKQTALHSALDELRGKDYDNLVKDIEDIQNKSKRAYVRLYEKVGAEIEGNFLEKLDFVSRQ